jgi:putative ABC transport system permease protein
MKKDSQPTPPAWANRFFEWYCAPELREDLQGDLHERFFIHLKEKGMAYARWRFIADVMAFLRPYVLRRKRSPYSNRSLNMFGHYMKTALRNVNRDKQYLAINTVGLALGIASALLLIAYIYNELSFDRHFENAGRTYRVSCSTLIDNSYTEFAPSPPAVGLALKETLPEIEAHARFMRTEGNIAIAYQNNSFYQENIFFADSTIFNVFSYRFILGGTHALQGDKRIVLSNNLAERLFGEDYLLQKDILERTVKIGPVEFSVSAVIQDAPYNSHVQPAAFIGWHGYGNDHVWNDSHAYTYIRLSKEANPVNVQKKIDRFTAENPNIRNVAEEFGAKVTVFIQPLTDLHLYSTKSYELSANGNMNYIFAFAIIALFFLLSSGINYTNLAIAASAHRYKEIGVRKVMGALRDQIRKQFITESVLMTFFSALLGLFFFYLMIPQFNSLMDYQLDIRMLGNATFALIAFGVIVLLSILSGFYPAFYLSLINPITVFKNSLNTGSKKMHFRKILLMAQFSISAIMIIAVLTVSRQMNFLSNKDLGFNKENILLVSVPNVYMRDLPVLKEELLKLSGVSGVAACGYAPGPGNKMIDEHFIERANGEMKSATVSRIFFDRDYLNLMQLPIVQGRGFDSRRQADYKEAFLVNEAAVKAFEWDKSPQGAIGRKIDGFNYEKKGEVIGVVKDVNLFSLRNHVEPLIMNLSDYESRLYVRIEGHRTNETMDMIEKTYKRVFPNHPLEYQFLDERIDRLYAADKKINAALVSGSQILIFISCLGLFGLSAFMVTQRTKEIGVRKVLGASMKEIMALLSGEYVRLIVIANVIAIPAGYFFINEWLDGFAYRIEFSWWLLIVPLLVTMVLAFLSILYQVARASRTNPVNALKYE